MHPQRASSKKWRMDFEHKAGNCKYLEIYTVEPGWAPNMCFLFGSMEHTGPIWRAVRSSRRRRTRTPTTRIGYSVTSLTFRNTIPY